MAGDEKLDELREFVVEESEDRKRKIPIGWLVLFWALILWGIYYFATYSPLISGWTQEKAYEESLKN